MSKMSKQALNVGAVELMTFLWRFAPTRGGEEMGLLVWKGGCLQGKETGQREHRTSLQSVSNSETDVTVNLSTFIELLTVRTTQKAQ